MSCVTQGMSHVAQGMSRVAQGMSHAGLGLREEPLYKGTIRAWDLGSSRNHLSTFPYHAFNTKCFIYHIPTSESSTS